jgi:hypothetical protein
MTICFAYKGGLKIRYDSLQPIGGVITQDARPKIVEASLTLIFKFGQEWCYNLFCR